MGSENFNVLEELKSLDQQVSTVGDLAGLKPIFYRLDEIARQYSDDFEVQLVVGDIKQHLVTRGARLKEQRERPTEATALPPTLTMAVPPDPPQPTPSAGDPTWISPPLLPTAPMAVQPVPPPPPNLPFGSSGPPTLPPQAFPPQLLPTQAMPIQGTPSSGVPVMTPPGGPPPPPTRPPVGWKRTMLIGALGGAVFFALVVVLLVNVARKRNQAPPEVTVEVAVDIVTVPTGASVRVNSETKCTSDCKISLPPGNYQITAFLDGYEPFASGLTLVAGEPKSLNLPLEPQAQSVRILTDFEKGKVALDDQPPADLQDGQFLFEKVPQGRHTVKVTSGIREASFSFELSTAALPSVTGPVAAKNVLAVLVSSFNKQARVVTSKGPWKLAVNGQEEGDASPAGIDLKNFQAGADDLVFLDGKAQYSVKETFGPAPMLTAKILTPDQNTGTLIVSTEENDVTVMINNRPWPTRTARGQIRIQAPVGVLSVRVAKQGFQDLPAKPADVKKGEEVRLEFKMVPMVQVSSLEVIGASPGTEVRIDRGSIGTVGSDGSFRNGSITPGNHTIELARPQFTTRSFDRTFRQGQTVTLSGLDVLLAADRPATPPPPVETPKPAAPPPKAAPPPPPAAPRTISMEGFEDPTQWKEENGVFRHRGQGFFPYKVPVNGGVLTFNAYLIRGGGLLRGSGRLRWRVNFTDEKNYTLFELDEDNLYSRDVVNGKGTDRPKQKHNVPSKDKVWPIKIEISPDKVVTLIQTKEQQWVTLDTFAPTGRNLTGGKIGFFLQGGGDEMGLSDLTFRTR